MSLRALWMVPLLALSSQALSDGNPTGAPPDWPTHLMGDERYGMINLDRLEYGNGDGTNWLWDLQGWYGGDYNKLWVESEGEGPTGESPDVAELQVLYDRLISPFWSLQTGLRHDLRPDGPDVTFASIGFQGLAPQWFETDVALFVSEDGDVSFGAEAEYDLLLTQRLILQPRLELNASASDVPELGVGSGLTRSEAGLRLRYEIRRELAPYLGVRWEQLHGETRDRARDNGEELSGTWFVVGLKAWF